MKIDKKKFLIILVILTIIQVIRSFSGGWVYQDEQYYVSLGYRFTTGTRMFVDDVGIAQMMGFILVPIIKLYLLIFSTTEGIILYVRFCYVIMSLISTLLIYKRFNKESAYAWLAALIFFIFVPFSLMSMSYNTMSINFLIQSVCLYDIKNVKLKESVISGILFSLSVVCNPYLAILYILSSLYIIFIDKKDYIKKNYLYSFIGIALILVIFLLFVFAGNNISDVINSFQYMIDPSHSNSKIDMLLKSLSQFKDAFGYLILIQGVISLISCIKDNKYIDLANVLISILSIAYYFIFSRSRLYAGGFSVLFTSILLVYMPSLIRRKDIYSIYFLIFLFHGFCFLLSSNVGARAISNEFVNIAVISIICLDDYKYNKMIHNVLICVLSMSLLTCRLLLDNSGMVDYSKQIKSGPFKYLYTSEESASTLEKEYNNIKQLEKYNDSNKIFVVANSPWIYLSIEDKQVINFSTFQYYSYKEDYLNMFKIYMNNHTYDNYYLLILGNELGIEIKDFNLDNAQYIEDIGVGDLYLITN